MNEQADVLIIGGAVMGSAVAYFLSESAAFRGKIIVLEKDTSYRASASALSTSGIRQQFSTSVNIKLSQFTVDFMKSIERNLAVNNEASGVTFHQNGYLYLGGASAVDLFEQNNSLQRSLGVAVDLLDRSDLTRRFPWLSVDDVEIGSFGRIGEGWTDGYMLMAAFRKRARANGVEYRHVEATGLMRAGARITGVECADGTAISAGHVVNTAGGSGRAVAHMAGIQLPIRNVKQLIFSFESPFRAEGMPYVLAPDGLMFRPEGKDYIAGIGIVMRDDGEESNLEIDHQIFDDEVWPKLARRVTGFEETRVRGAWAGHYDMNLFDHNPIIGAVSGLEGFYLANGFSGHGLMHSPGVGRAIAELILYGSYRTLDLSELSFERIAANAPVRERIQY